MTRFRIEVPATSANLGPGFDTLGMALDIVNTIELELTPDCREVIVAGMTGEGEGTLDPEDNLLCRAYKEWEEHSGVTLPGARFTYENRIPIGRGLGASAAAIVAGLAAGAAAAEEKEPRDRIVRLSSLMEGHADNAVAAALGGVTTAFLARGQVHALHVANHLNLGVGLFVPSQPLLTVKARAVLPPFVSMEDAVFNINRVSYLVTALIWGRWDRIGPAMEDCLHQPYRAEILPALPAVISAAREAGAYGAALSGGGPTVIALGPQDRAEAFAAAMAEAARSDGWDGRHMVTGIRHRGVRVIKDEAPAAASV